MSNPLKITGVIFTVFLLALAGCDLGGGEVGVTGITLSESSVSIVVGSDEQLSASVEPADATNQSVTWESSNDAVAEVDADGLVSASRLEARPSP